MTSEDFNTLKGNLTLIMTRLKAETKDYHSKLESLPYFKALIAHQLPLECYVNQLRALAVIHGVLENEIAASGDKRVSAIWDNELRKLPLLEEDIAFFKPRVVSDAASSIAAALAMTEKIRLRRIENPVMLLGYLYVLEGSTLGNRMHRPDISATFHLNGLNGCHYYSSYLEHVQGHWNQFSEKMNVVLNDPSLHDRVIEAAHEAFEGLDVLYNALYPLEKNEKFFHVTRINPEAGNHPIPEDEREIQAALKASDRGWAEFPYYDQRYGVRGKRFSDSDACWLATLTALDPETLQKQIDWLGRVLSTRGMPQIMLERILRYLHEELTISVPDKASAANKLLAAAQKLCEQRTACIPEKESQRMASEFDTHVGAELADMYKNSGELLLSTVADEKNGVEGAISAIQEWMTDPDRFPEQWILAVNETIQKAKQLSDSQCG
ncbi:MAG: biliverdin-producing heme oxygenase [Rhodocyclaceae bacterium]|nr:biliverdin-producing heme oxygenase [Rhodocyclaceae bacterium]